MADYPQDIGDGALFKNREKTKPSQPDYFGKATIEGRKLRVSAWIKESQKNAGQKYMSLSFRPEQSAEDNDQGKRDWQAPTDPEVPLCFAIAAKPHEFGGKAVTILAFRSSVKGVPVLCPYDEVKSWWFGKPARPEKVESIQRSRPPGTPG